MQRQKINDRTALVFLSFQETTVNYNGNEWGYVMCADIFNIFTLQLDLKK